jgi:hypothetical protein
MPAISGHRFDLFITRLPLNPVSRLWCIKSFSIQRTNGINDTTTFVDDTVEFFLGQQDNSIGITRVTYNITAYYIDDVLWELAAPVLGERLLFEFGVTPEDVVIFQDYVVVKSITSSLDVNGAYQIDVVAELDIDEYF